MTTSNSTTNATISTANVPVAEPGPDWSVARKLWGPAWQLHWVGLGVAFALLAVHSMVAMLMADKTKAFTRRLLFYAINSLLVTIGMVRAFYLWIDPYESGEHGFSCELWVTRALFGLAFPCLTSAFCLIHVAFLEVSQFQIGSRKLHSLPFVSSIIVLHFIVVLVSDITVAFEADKTELLIVCQSFFIVWGFANSIAFLYSGGKVILTSRQIQQRLNTISQQHPTNNDGDAAKKKTTLKVAKITMVTAFLGFACCGLQIYSMVGVYGLYSTVVNPAPWPWYGFQTCFRVAELAMGCTLAYTVIQPSEEGSRVLFRRLICRRRRATVKPAGSLTTIPRPKQLHSQVNSTFYICLQP